MNPTVNNNSTYSHLNSGASTSTGQSSSSPAQDSLRILRQPIPDHLGDYERETVMADKKNALGRMISDFEPGSDFDFSDMSFGDMDISQAVASGLQNQWTDAGVERYLNRADGNNLPSAITNSNGLTSNQRIQFMSGLIDSLEQSGVNLNSISDSVFNDMSNPIYASSSNVSNFRRNISQRNSNQNAEQQHIRNMQDILEQGSSSSPVQSDNYVIPEAQGYGNVKGIKDNPNEYLAETANTIVRNRFKNKGVKSTNKVNPNDQSSIERRNSALDAIRRVRESFMAKWDYDFTQAMKEGAGNCGEMSGIAEQYINQSGGYARKYEVDDLGTHAFTLVGKPPRDATDNIHFSDYDKCWVVDPWANIVCKASDYTKLFRDKMDDWFLEGKMLCSPDGWIEANDPEWVKAVTEGIKTPERPETYYKNNEEQGPQNEPKKEISPPVRNELENLDPQKESTTTEDMQKALKKAKELGPDTFLRWLDEADVAKRLAEGILSGQSVNSCGLLLEDLANDLLDLLKEGAVSAKSICSALFPPKAKEFIMAVIPQLMLKPAGVRLTKLMEQLAQKDEGTRSDLVDSMSKRSCVPSIERANSEKSDFYDRVDSVYERSVIPKLTALRKGKLDDHLPLALFKKASDTLENGRLLLPNHKKIASFTKIRNEAERIAQALGSEEVGNRTITPEMLRDSQVKDDESYNKQKNAIVAFRKSYIKTKTSADMLSTAKQHRPEPSWVRNLYDFAMSNLTRANESNDTKTAEWESRQVRIEDQPGAASVATDSFFVRTLADAAIKGAERDAASMAGPSGRDITSMTRQGELRREVPGSHSQRAPVKDLHKVWEDAFNLLESGVDEKYQQQLLGVMGACETAIYTDALQDYLAAFKAINAIGNGIVEELNASGWGGLVTETEPAPVEEKEPEKAAPAESSPTSSPPSKKNKKSRQALLA